MSSGTAAQHCLIRLTWENETVGAEVINDGGREVRADGLSARPGLGLAGLRERVTALGGRMEAGLLPWSDKDHFRLWVELPLQSRAQSRMKPAHLDEQQQQKGEQRSLK